ncbi:putative lipid-binding transport protein (Tim44 family) [Rhodoferax ferrireducens]|uniref:Lipid-binding transport protein (Tim44 family) n=1 Tax=Rhodoferax ferrireducens TaxID=192843 RepID=A0ABU2C7N9_9BURK|nr:Tim44-like domain-containing protein [Rhodoferax ferrireducens]MDR7377351.1 putative lipid-binding transport protein (Tim44 family) [Rhodoferax ferrireducens]
MKFWAIVLAATIALGAGFDAEAARRMGGGKSIGQQSSNVTQRQAAPAAPAAPAQNANNTAPKPATAAPAAAAPKRPWGAMLGGLAAGLGLAWLANSLGLGAAMGQFMLIALVVLVGMVLFSWFMRSRRNAGAPSSGNSPFAFQGASPAAPATAPAYRVENVGNDASARPFERSNSLPLDGAVSGSMIGSALAGAQGWGVPAGFDSEGFLKAAKNNFITLQSAWDRSDISSLRAMMTDTMLGEIQSQLNERETHTGGQVNKTDVVMLEAKLLGIEDLGNDYMASVEFSGMIREEPSAGPSPFREVWNMTKPKNGGSGWLVAGVQALQ